MKPIIQFIAPVLLVVMFFGFFIFSSKVPAGYEAILVDMYGQNGVKDMPLVTGRVFYNPVTKDLVQYPVFVQTKDYDQFSVNAKDGATFTVDPTIGYRIKAGSSPLIYEKYRKDIDDITDVVMLQLVKDAFRTVINKYSTDEILSKRAEIESDIGSILKETAGSDGIVIENLTSGLQYPETIIKSIDAKNEAVQEAQKVENQLRIAEADAKIRTTKAEAEAKSLLIQARAESEANQLKQKAITPLLIQQQYIEKWDGKLPVYGTTPTLFKTIE